LSPAPLPPPSPLFPYTTLFRSLAVLVVELLERRVGRLGDGELLPPQVSGDLGLELLVGQEQVLEHLLVVLPVLLHLGLDLGRARSEEHTSELQSHLNLVCRLLL